jgi:hypothetical protein
LELPLADLSTLQTRLPVEKSRACNRDITQPGGYSQAGSYTITITIHLQCYDRGAKCTAPNHYNVCSTKNRAARALQICERLGGSGLGPAVAR